jgi:hypothetical protein
MRFATDVVVVAVSPNFPLPGTRLVRAALLAAFSLLRKCGSAAVWTGNMSAVEVLVVDAVDVND